VTRVNEFLRYIVAGGSALAVQLAILSLLVEGGHVDQTVATTIGFAAAIVVNYSLQRRYVFRTDAAHRKALVRYLLVTLAAMALNAVLFKLLTAELGVFYALAQVITTGLLFVLNFFVNRFFTFAASG
jgi:putative flippase GtrA